MWSNDYPHTESTWPHSRKIVEELMAGVPDAERDKLVASNAALLYGIQLPPAS
jgi:predicted TIM-barrel fold metal-dependent hydrolase